VTYDCGGRLVGGEKANVARTHYVLVRSSVIMENCTENLRLFAAITHIHSKPIVQIRRCFWREPDIESMAQFLRLIQF
jgi:hypothetical protein